MGVITMFVNDPSMFDSSYQRFLINRLREILGDGAVGEAPPLRFRENNSQHLWATNIFEFRVAIRKPFPDIPGPDCAQDRIG